MRPVNVEAKGQLSSFLGMSVSSTESECGKYGLIFIYCDKQIYYNLLMFRFKTLLM